MRHRKTIIYFVNQFKIPIFLAFLVFLCEILLSIFFYSNETYIRLQSYIDGTEFILFILIFVWIFFKLISIFDSKIKNKSKYTNIDNSLIRIIFKSIIVSIALLISMNKFGINISGILTISGISGVAAGLAGREFLANVFGFIAINMDRTFKIGDSIFLPDKKISGTVESISLRCTKIITDEKRSLSMPNSLFSTIVVQNDTIINHWFIKEKVIFFCKDEKLIKSIKEKLSSFVVGNFKDFISSIDFFVSGVSSSCFLVNIKAIVNTNDKVKFIYIKEEILYKLLDISRRKNVQFISSDDLIIAEGVNFSSVKDVKIREEDDC